MFPTNNFTKSIQICIVGEHTSTMLRLFIWQCFHTSKCHDYSTISPDTRFNSEVDLCTRAKSELGLHDQSYKSSTKVEAYKPGTSLLPPWLQGASTNLNPLVKVPVLPNDARKTRAVLGKDWLFTHFQNVCCPQGRREKY